MCTRGARKRMLPTEPAEPEVVIEPIPEEPSPAVREPRVRPPIAKRRRVMSRIASPASDVNNSRLLKIFKDTSNKLTTRIDELSAEIKRLSSSQDRDGKSYINEDNQDVAWNQNNEPRPEPLTNEYLDQSSDITRSVIYNIRNINLEKPKFGDKVTDPITFLEDLENYLKKASKEGKDLDLVQECLVDGARDWARIYRGRWARLEDFKSDFLATYWGENEQNELRRTVSSGVWDRQKSPSMLSYFLKLAGRAQKLTYKLPEKQLVSDIVRHYPRYVQQGMITSKISTIIEAAEYLRVADDVNKQTSPVIHNSTSAPPNRNFEKRRRDLQQNYQKWQRPETNQKTRQTVVSVAEQENQNVQHGQVSQDLN